MGSASTYKCTFEVLAWYEYCDECISKFLIGALTFLVAWIYLQSRGNKVSFAANDTATDLVSLFTYNENVTLNAVLHFCFRIKR